MKMKPSKKQVTDELLELEDMLNLVGYHMGPANRDVALRRINVIKNYLLLSREAY